MILERLGAISETKNWSLKGPLDIKGKPLDTPPNQSPMHTSQNSNNVANPTRPAPPRPSNTPNMNRPPQRPSELPKSSQVQQNPSVFNPNAAVNNGGSGLFSSIRGGAGSFLKNLKDTSSKVMQTVQQSMGRTDLDISYITQKIIVMPCPSEGLESAYKTNNIEDVKLYLESRHPPSKISVYNFGPRSCPRLAPPVRTVEGSFIYQTQLQKAPILNGMFSLAEDMFGFLNVDPKNVVVIQSPDTHRSATMLAALLIYGNLVQEPEDAMQIFAVKRHPPNMKTSEIRYLYYMCDILRSVPHLPHYKPITLVSINFSPIPKMTKNRDGVRCFVEVACNDRVVISTLQEYEKMR